MYTIIVNNIPLKNTTNKLCIYCYCCFHLMEFFRNLDEVFTYNHIWL